MISARVFTFTYLLSLLVAILSGFFIFSIVFPWPGLVAMWVLILFVFGFYVSTHTSTDFLNLQQFHLTVVIMLPVQVIAGGMATLVYLVNGQFYAPFLTFEVVCFAFLLIDWFDDAFETHRARSSVPRLDH